MPALRGERAIYTQTLAPSKRRKCLRMIQNFLPLKCIENGALADSILFWRCHAASGRLESSFSGERRNTKCSRTFHAFDRAFWYVLMQSNDFFAFWLTLVWFGKNFLDFDLNTVGYCSFFFGTELSFYWNQRDKTEISIGHLSLCSAAVNQDSFVGPWLFDCLSEMAFLGEAV